MDRLLNDQEFVEQLLRSYLSASQQEKFNTRSCAVRASGGPCILVIDNWGSLDYTLTYTIWLELSKTPAGVFVILYELRGSTDCVVAINVSDPNGPEIMKEIIEDKLCELSTTSQRPNLSSCS